MCLLFFAQLPRLCFEEVSAITLVAILSQLSTQKTTELLKEPITGMSELI